MPQLSSGRHVCISASLYLDALNQLSDEQKTYLIVQYRMTVTTPEDLLPQLTVGYFDLSTGEEPPFAPAYPTAYTVQDVLDGKSDFSEVETKEFKQWIDEKLAGSEWLTQQFNDIDLAIRHNDVWKSDLWADVNGEQED